MAARRCFLLLIRHLTFHGKSLVGMENYLTIFIRLVERSVKACKMATEMALSVFSTHEKTKGLCIIWILLIAHFKTLS